jgi:hypothetical protein
MTSRLLISMDMQCPKKKSRSQRDVTISAHAKFSEEFNICPLDSLNLSTNLISNFIRYTEWHTFTCYSLFQLLYLMSSKFCFILYTKTQHKGMYLIRPTGVLWNSPRLHRPTFNRTWGALIYDYMRCNVISFQTVKLQLLQQRFYGAN